MSRYKVGDIVIVINPKSIGYKHFKGRLGIVLGINKTFDDLVRVDFNGSGQISFFNDEIELAKNQIVRDIINDL